MNGHVLHMKRHNAHNSAMDALGPLLESRGDEVTTWLKSQYGSTPNLFYSSVDLRRSEHKLVPVDTNLFPAGFNLLNEASRKRGSEQVSAYIKLHYPGARRIILIPENHTRNTYYLQNVFALQSILLQSQPYQHATFPSIFFHFSIM